MKVVCKTCSKQIDFVEGVDAGYPYADLRIWNADPYSLPANVDGYFCSSDCIRTALENAFLQAGLVGVPVEK